MKRNKTGLIRICVLAAALLLIAAGIQQRQPEMVLQKAVHICLECIGIG
ncbi:MAG: CD1871A family CXXC motif-containing protein [Lachnospiraceae bacterium]|nr:CD1871A family CXXC motif-containing protein [Lachnospiraceae bacterium]